MLFDPESPEVLDSEWLLDFAITKACKTLKTEEDENIEKNPIEVYQERLLAAMEDISKAGGSTTHPVQPESKLLISYFLSILVGAMLDHRRPNYKDEFVRRRHQHTHQLDTDS